MSIRTFLFCFFILVLPGAALATGGQVSMNGLTYIHTGDHWEARDGDQTFLVQQGVVTVRFSDGISGQEEFRRLLQEQGGDQELGWLPVIRVNRLGIHDLELMSNQDPVDIAIRLEATGLVRYAEPATIGRWIALPSDPRFSDQYHLRNTGQTGGTSDADIDADEAWDITPGAPSAVVAIVDSGTYIDHTDLAGNLWKNTADTPGNGRDDDGNGYADDYDGWDFEGNDGDPRSSNGHGTQVAGIVAARTDNGTGVSGIAGGGFGSGNGARLMPLKVGTSGPIGSVLDDAIIYAADNGADIITMSLSVGNSSAINDALDYAYNTMGVFIDCASGNNYSSSVAYPANNINVMAVGATDHNDNRESYSNYGSTLEVVAPGSGILSTGLNNTYVSGSGTSFAAPCTAGVAALIVSRNGSQTNAQIRQILKDTADDVGASGYDLQTGYGRVNARAALDATPPPECIDGDGDGFYPYSGCGTDVDCDDGDSLAYPGAPEVCADGIDQDCDGLDKQKGKGCNDPGGGGDAKENCKNGLDDDGDGMTDCDDPECASKKFCL